MSVLSTDIDVFLSGGAANTDPNAALGGAISTTEVVDGGLHNVFDAVSASESAAGDVEYRALYVKNSSATNTLAAARIFISAGDALQDIALALADEAVSTTIETIADESTAPVGPVFSRPTDYAGGLQLNSSTGLAVGEYKGVWLRRTIAASTAAQAAYAFSLTVQGDTT